MVVYLLSGEGPDTKILLGSKGRGLGEGRIVGPGGKVMAGESPADAATREVAEEVTMAVRPGDLVHRATIHYPFLERPQHSQRSFVFTATRFSGEPNSTEELIPEWFPVSDIPWGEMWDDARRWLPRVLAGEFVEATFTIGLDDRVVDEVWH